MNQSRNRRIRPDRSRPRKTIIRVLAEGKVTETNYIDVLKQKYRGSIEIEVMKGDAGSSPKILVSLARNYRKRQDKNNPEFDEIWCIFDVDQHPNLESAIHEARDSNINIAISNPCFELWLVLHCQDQTSHINRRDIQKMAKRLGILKGKHLSEDGANIVRENYEEAKSRAQRLEKRHIGDNSEPWANPSSQMWKFVDRLALLAEVGDG